MDGIEFDNLVRRLLTHRTRRGLLGLLAALPLAGPTEAARKRRQQPVDAEACIPSGKRCPSRYPRKYRMPHCRSNPLATANVRQPERC
jgi:hypothetical protein